MIDDYFEVTPKDEWTWTGLALHLDTDKWTLTDYRDRIDYEGTPFAPSLKRALLKVENGYEIDLKKHGRAGSIFALKNFDWRDKTESEITNPDGSLNPHKQLSVEELEAKIESLQATKD